jgi:hypothetical protein
MESVIISLQFFSLFPDVETPPTKMRKDTVVTNGQNAELAERCQCKRYMQHEQTCICSTYIKHHKLMLYRIFYSSIPHICPNSISFSIITII